MAVLCDHGSSSIASCYLSTILQAIKGHFCYFFVNAVPSRIRAFREACASFYDLFLDRNVGGFAGEMQMFENLAAEA